MKQVKAIKNFTIDNKEYIVGDIVDTKDINVITKLNEKGFIEPLSYEDLVLIKRGLNNKNIMKED